MKTNTTKYFVLTGLLLLSLLGFALLIVLLFLALKLFAVTAFYIPGSTYLFTFFITVIPYFILFAAYFLMHRRISSSVTNASSVAARVLLTAGSIVCIAQLTIALLILFNVRIDWLDAYESYNKAWFALHLILILIAAGVLATGDPKEKNWIERESKSVDSNKG